MDRWSEAKARDWQKSIAWLMGCNYLPSYAVNFKDFWHEERFDLEVIERELALAVQTGLNALRVNLNYCVWKHEGEAHLKRVDAFMDAAAQRDIKVVLVPFDDCQFSGGPAQYALQPEPIKGTHNSRAIGSPGREIVMNWQNEPELETYFKAIITRYIADQRVAFWDLYNEPGNRMQFIDNQQSEFVGELETQALGLMEACFAWAREIEPIQPLTVGAWHVPYDWEHEHLPETWEEDGALLDGKRPFENRIDRRALALSDIISFHGYVTQAQMEKLLRKFLKLDRPTFITEWLARPAGSLIAEQLPLFQENQVGCFHLGLINGKTQTHLPWPFLGIEAGEWFHDLYHGNGTPYDQTEIALFQSLSPRT